MKTTAQQKILQFFRENPDWYAVGSLERMEFRNADGTIASGKSINRRCQELREQGYLDVEYRGKHHAHYRIKKEHVKPVYRYEFIDGIMRETRVR